MLEFLRWLIRLEWPFRLANPVFGLYNPFLAERRADPYPWYRALREREPVYFSRVFRAWLLTRHEDVVRVLRDGSFSVDRSQLQVPKFLNPFANSMGSDFAETILRTLLMVDPPDHTRLRGLVNKAFTLRVVEGLRPRIQTLVDELLDPADAAGEIELMRDLAEPLPITVIAEMLGIPTSDRADLKRWSDDLTALLDPFNAPKGLPGAERAFAELAEYFRAIFAQRRREPQQDLISALVAAEEGGDVLTERELLGICALIMGAGHETTTHLIGNAVVALLRNPGERKRLQDDPSLIQTAVEEFLRYDGPVQLTDRVATADCEIGGKAIRAGQIVAVVLGAANRDPAVFEDPDRLDLARRENPHVSFGQGVHFCLGAQLARAEAQIAIATLLRRFPDLDGGPDPAGWTPSMLLRGPTALSLSLR